MAMRCVLFQIVFYCAVIISEQEKQKKKKQGGGEGIWSCACHEGMLGSGGIAPDIPNFRTKWRTVVRFTVMPLYPQGKSCECSLHRRLGRLHSPCLRNIITCMSRNGIVGVATLYPLECSEFELRWGRDFPYPSSSALGPTWSPVQGLLLSLPGCKAAGT